MNKLITNASMFLLVVVAGLALSSTAYASPCETFRCNDTQIETLYPTGISSGVVYVRPADGGLFNLTCTPDEGVYLRLESSHPLFSEIYSALLSTTLAKTRISFRLNDDTNACRILYVTLKGS